MEKVDFSIEQGNATLTASKKYTANGTSDGISPDDVQKLQTDLDDASAKDTAQKKAVEFVLNQTDLQAKTMAKLVALIRKAQNAAKGVYGEDDKARMSEFHVGGKNQLETVKSVLSEAKYMKSVTMDHKGDLAVHGFKDADIASFDTLASELTTNNANQKDALKVQKGSTADRDASMKTLQKTIRKIRKSAKAIFADKPSILIEFEPVAQGRHGTKATPAPAPQTQATDKSK